MEVEEWPFVCPSCNVTIPNQTSLIAHKSGKKHILKQNEYLRREEEATRTLFISGNILKNPELAQLLLKTYFEDNFGAVEKITIQERVNSYRESNII